MAHAHELERALGVLAGGSLRGELPLGRQRAALQLGDPPLQLRFGELHGRTLRPQPLLGLRELTPQLLQAPRQHARFVLAVAEALAQALDVRAALALDRRDASFGLRALALLGVLALLESPQLVLDDPAGGRLLSPGLAATRAQGAGEGGALGLDQRGQTRALVVGFAQALLQAG